MSTDIQQETQQSGSFEVKPEEKDLEAKLLQNGANPTDVARALTERRRVKLNLENQKKLEEPSTQNTGDMFQKDGSNPFGTVSKQRFLREAFNAGVHDTGELQKLSDIFDMVVAPDTGVLDESTMGIADSLRAEYFTRTKENGYLEADQMYKKVLGTSDSPAGDVSLIFAYMKLLDPTSVVRESEQSLAQNAGSFGSRVQNAVSQLTSGKRLTAEQRKDFINEARNQFQIYQQKQEPIDLYYSSISRRYGIDPSLVGVGLYDTGEDYTDDPLNLGSSRATSDNPLGI